MYEFKGVLHYPNLKTVLMVEEILRRAGRPIKRNELKKRLPKQIMHQTLNIILAYLEESGKILDTRRGIVWIFSESKKLKQAIEKGELREEMKQDVGVARKQIREGKGITTKKLMIELGGN